MSPLLAAFLGIAFGFGTGVTLMYALVMRDARPSYLGRRAR